MAQALGPLLVLKMSLLGAGTEAGIGSTLHRGTQAGVRNQSPFCHVDGAKGFGVWTKSSGNGTQGMRKGRSHRDAEDGPACLPWQLWHSGVREQWPGDASESAGLRLIQDVWWGWGHSAGAVGLGHSPAGTAEVCS